MKSLKGRHYVEVKDKRYRIQASEQTILILKEEPKSLGTQYQKQIETQIKKSKSY